jgi:SAM-dependent methyltransferase
MQFELSDEERLNLETYSSEKALQHYSRLWLFESERQIFDKYLMQFQGRGDFRLLDLGCGAGRTTYPLYKMGFQVIGVDISEKMVEKASSNFTDIDFRVGDACDLEFPDETFNCVFFSFNGIDYIYPESKRIKAFREAHRVLKEGSLFIFSSHNSWWIGITPSTALNRLIHFSRNALKGRTFSKYKIDRPPYGDLITYYTSPKEQKVQLEQHGFTLIDIYPEGVLRNNKLLRYLAPWIYYVTRKGKNFEGISHRD